MTKPPSKRSQLLAWIKSRPYVVSYQVYKWGDLHKYTCGYRRCAEWAEAKNGILERLTDRMKKARGINTVYAAWRPVK